MTQERLLKMKEVCNILAVSPITLRRWDNSGKLPAVRINKQGDRRWKESTVNDFVKNQASSTETIENKDEDTIIEL